MAVVTISGSPVDLKPDGFFADPHEWTEAMVPELARREGIENVTPRHWDVIRFMRHEYETKSEAPSVRALSKLSGVPIKELYQLFPKGPAKTAARIAGVPKPRGCI